MADQVIQRLFTGGEIDPALRSRSDLGKYVSGLSLCENYIAKSQGGADTRPGTKYIDEIKNMAAKGRLIPFSFNTEQNYILVFENNVMRVIKDGGYVLDPTLPFELITTYTTAQLSRLVFVQDADVMTITHLDHDPARLVRIADNNWTLADVDYTSQVSPATGAAVAAVGTASTLANKTFRYVVTAVNTSGVESLPTAEVSHTINDITNTYGSSITWTASVDSDIDYYRVYRDNNSVGGSTLYAWVGDTKTLVFEDFNIAPDASDTPPEDFEPFSGANDKPATVGFFQQRQFFANTDNNPQDISVTELANYESMRSSRPARSTDAIFFTLKAEQVNEFRHIVGLDSLIFFTSGGEWKMTEGQERVLTPFSIGLRRQSRWGSSHTRPVIVGDSIIFIQEKGNRVRDLFYEVGGQQEKYIGNELSSMSYHLFKGFTIDEMDYADEPDGILWCIRSDGRLLGLTYQREHNVWAWHQHTTPLSGEFESVAVISEGGRDVPYFIVKRTVNSSTVRYIERFEPAYNVNTDTVNDVWYVDSGLQYNGVPATVMTGLDHLENENVHGVADGNVVGPLLVTGGSVTIPNEASKVTLGLLYIPALETLDIEPESLKQTLKGSKIAVAKVTIEVLTSRGGFVGAKNDDGSLETLYEIKPRFDSDNYDALDLKSFKQEVTVDSGWDKGGAIRIEQRAPMPLNILSVTTDVDIS